MALFCIYKNSGFMAAVVTVDFYGEYRPFAMLVVNQGWQADPVGALHRATTYAKRCVSMGGEWTSVSPMTDELEYFEVHRQKIQDFEESWSKYEKETMKQNLKQHDTALPKESSKRARIDDATEGGDGGHAEKGTLRGGREYTKYSKQNIYAIGMFERTRAKLQYQHAKVRASPKSPIYQKKENVHALKQKMHEQIRRIKPSTHQFAKKRTAAPHQKETK